MDNASNDVSKESALMAALGLGHIESEDDDDSSVEQEGSTRSPRPSSDTALSLDSKTQVTALNYIAEHRIFLKAILELLSQRDSYQGIDVDINDPNTFKCGPLRKAAVGRGAWRYKYVEIRRGLLSYYDNVSSRDSLQQTALHRKNVALQYPMSVRPVKVVPTSTSKRGPGKHGGAAFELAIEGRPKKFFLANSRQERQAWINAIQDAMVGGSVVRGQAQTLHSRKRSSVISPKSPYHSDLQLYLKMQSSIGRACTKHEYMEALQGVSSLSVPVQWIRDRANEKLSAEGAFHEEDTSVGVGQLWKDLLRDSVSINGELFQGNGGHGPEKIIGALVRSIMMLDKTFANSAGTYPTGKSSVTESQALSYARDVLLAGNRTRSGGDSFFCVDMLTKHPGLVVLCPSATEAEPLQVTVQQMQHDYNTLDLSGWIKSKSVPSKPFKKRYFVLSEGTLSYYEQATPRPHGLRDQLALKDASLSITEETIENREGQLQKRQIVHISMKDGSKGRQLCFDNQDKFFLWAQTLEDACDFHQAKAPRSSSLKKSVVNKVRRGLRDEMEDMVEGDAAVHCLKEYAASHGLDDETLEQRIAMLRIKSGKAKSKVQINVKATTVYKVSTADPQGFEEEDTWVWICANFLQNFVVSGGPSGRINRGEEVVQITFQDKPNA